MEMSYGIRDLRERHIVTQETVKCHVRGCESVKKRQRQTFKCDEDFLCEEHGIYISPTTFQYKDYHRNLLWHDTEDQLLLDSIKQVKRTMARLGRERDEDALSWNVVRAFQKGQCLNHLARNLLAETAPALPELSEPEVIYWSADKDGQLWSLLQDAQQAFCEQPYRGTEPDVVLYWPEQALIFIEAKFCATNTTTPSHKENDYRPAAYGEHPHFSQVFQSCYEEIAVKQQKYQLMRMWLLGTWIAAQVGVPFGLVNLTRRSSVQQSAQEDNFGARFCRQHDRQCFCSATWEGIWESLPQSGLSPATGQHLDAYLRNKSCGYDAQGTLQKAFQTVSK